MANEAERPPAEGNGPKGWSPVWDATWVLSVAAAVSILFDLAYRRAGGKPPTSVAVSMCYAGAALILTLIAWSRRRHARHA